MAGRIAVVRVMAQYQMYMYLAYSTATDMDFQGTATCKEYATTVDGKEIWVIDTPGLDDAPIGNLAVLNRIAEKLQAGPNVSGVIYFHRVTNPRLAGSARSNIKIFQQICGAPFYYKTAFVTTMWNTIRPDQLSKFEKLNNELRGIVSGLTDGRTKFFEFDSSKAETANEVLKHFMLVPADRKGHELQLQLATEVKKFGASPGGVRRTQAGKQIVKDLNKGFNCVIL